MEGTQRAYNGDVSRGHEKYQQDVGGPQTARKSFAKYIGSLI